MDINLPDMSGIEAMRSMREIKPNLPILFLSMHPESRYAMQIFRLGGNGYVQKEALADELVNAVRTVLDGRKYVTPLFAEVLDAGNETENAAPHEVLSKREQEIFVGLAKGKSVTNLAEELSLSVKTISTYRTRILQKLSMTCNADLIYYAVKNQVITTDE